MAARVALLLGKPAHRSPVLPAVVECLRAHGAEVRVHVPAAGASLPGWLDGCDAVALRGLRPEVLAAVQELEQAHGLRCCNPADSTLAVRDRSAVHRRLAEAGVPVPDAATVADADEARRWAAGRAVAVKAGDAGAGRGSGVAMWSDPETGDPPAVPGPYLVQQWVRGDGVDRKLYVVGSFLGGLLKPRRTGSRAGEVFEPGRPLEELAVAAGRALRLRIFGVDVVEGPEGPVVVDVNAFPSCAGVPGAAEAIAGTLLDVAGAARR